ncbi:MAG: inositol monophosphatase family protein [Kaiparowitsia implicata GSE-PSE-MK54-09C]|jgi:3'(2'), 5'-bisphosphate nucleotidase|nr:inositol monophosphatase family protein [Kaiparowitsia implicata GSE-PSE-MK54-09C]
MGRFSESQLEQMRQLLVGCGQQAREMGAVPFEVFEKAKNDFVTAVDQALDARISVALAEWFPGDAVISEENSRSFGLFSTAAPLLWLIDPIDGTDDFIQRRPSYSTLVGLLDHFEPVAGWVGAPAVDQLYFGGKEFGVFEAAGDRPLTPLQQPTLPSLNEACTILIGGKDYQHYGQAIAQHIPPSIAPAQFHTVGSFGIKVMDVVLGRAGLYVYLNRRVKLWDTTGPVAIARAAGLICCDLEGAPLQFSPDVIQPDSLSHQQPILIGWPQYIETLRSPIQQAVHSIDSAQG